MILTGDVFDVLPTLDAESVHCVVTSPPYFGLRDYGTASWSGGDAECDHVERTAEEISARNTLGPDGYLPPTNAAFAGRARQYRSTCGKCGALRIDSQLGLEPTPEAYIERMVAVFREVRRVLRSDGTAWINIGDSYAAGGMSNPSPSSTLGGGKERGAGAYTLTRSPTHGLKPKDLVMIPARLALALQADGWWIRSDIIWAKPNPMPESVTDRPTSAHEHVFLLTPAARYFYDADAVRERVGEFTRRQRTFRGGCYVNNSTFDNSVDYSGHEPYSDDEPSLAGRNLRNVWTIATEPFPEAHFATYPKRLVEPCIKAGTSEKGCCGECGAPWEREVEATGGTIGRSWHDHAGDLQQGQRKFDPGGYARRSVGWRPTCAHGTEPVPCTVLDPFAGSGTTGVVAAKLGREFVGIELSPEYAAMAERRIANWRREYAENPAPKVLAGQEGLW